MLYYASIRVMRLHDPSFDANKVFQSVISLLMHGLLESLLL